MHLIFPLTNGIRICSRAISFTENNTAVPIERIVYSISTFQSYRDRSLGLGEEVLTPITEEERLQVKDTYPRMTMGMCNPKFLETISL